MLGRFGDIFDTLKWADVHRFRPFMETLTNTTPTFQQSVEVGLMTVMFVVASASTENRTKMSARSEKHETAFVSYLRRLFPHSSLGGEAQ